MGEQLNLSGIPDYLTPGLGSTGVWGSAGGMAMSESLRRGSLAGVMDLLESMDASGVASALREAGFNVPNTAIHLGRDAVFESVQRDLIEAIDLRVDGFELEEVRAERISTTRTAGLNSVSSFAAKPVKIESALDAIQNVMTSTSIVVDLFGDVLPGGRNSLVFVAGQALDRQIQGFGFDGIEGKYEVPLSMSDVAQLHRDASRSVAEESARTAIGEWASGNRVSEVSDWVPDSIQRLLHGSISVEAATALVNAVDGGMIGRHAGEIGAHRFMTVMQAHGYNVNAPTVEQQAAELGLSLVEPDTERGQYVGPLVGEDHRAGLVKYARTKAIELPFKDLADDQSRPSIGDTVRMKFKAGDLTVSVSERLGRESVER